MPLPGFSEEILKRNLSKCYNTAEGVIRLALKLQQDLDFLSHAPHSVFRALITATCVCLVIQRSHYGSAYEDEVGDALVNDALQAMSACSAQDGDIQMRGTKMVERYWSVRQHIPRTEIGKPADSSFTHRLGASLVFGCLRRFKREIEQVRSNNTGPNNLPAQGGAEPSGKSFPPSFPLPFLLPRPSGNRIPLLVTPRKDINSALLKLEVTRRLPVPLVPLARSPPTIYKESIGTPLWMISTGVSTLTIST